jgi:hypothetical protein
LKRGYTASPAGPWPGLFFCQAAKDDFTPLIIEKASARIGLTVRMMDRGFFVICEQYRGKQIEFPR